MNCLKPIMLKSGTLVPCGRCELCQSANRTEKSVLVQLHCDYFEKMPLFIGLTYDPEFLPYYCTCPTEERLDHAPAWSESRFYRRDEVEELKLSCVVPSLFRKDLSRFLKSYKRAMGLTNDKFQYFGCGEYGDTYNRPHYHLIWFGDDQLDRMFEHDVQKAERWLSEFWRFGHVDINRAEWSGIHYVTKYCLKDGQRFPLGALPPFTVSSNGIGLNWLNSPYAEKIRQQLLYCQFNKEKIFADIDLSDVDWTNHQSAIDVLQQYVDYLRPIVPNFKVRLPSGKTAYLPRKLKRRLLGSYQHFKDNPIWLYDTLVEWLETEKYLRDNQEYDMNHDRTASMEQRLQHALSINQRILRNRAKL